MTRGIKETLDQGMKTQQGTSELMIQEIKNGFNEMIKAMTRNTDDKQIQPTSQVEENRPKTNHNMSNQDESKSNESTNQDKRLESEAIDSEWLENQSTIQDLKQVIIELKNKIKKIEKDTKGQIDENKKEIENLKKKKEKETDKEIEVKERKPSPTVDIDEDGNPVADEQRTKEFLQPIDLAPVKNPWRKMPPRPKLSVSIQAEAKTNLEEHNNLVKEKIESNDLKIKKPKNITKKERTSAIQSIMKKQSSVIGVAPISKKQIYTVCESMTKSGILKRSEDLGKRLQRTVKSLVKAWAKKNLKMDDEAWDEIKIKEIFQTNSDDSNIVFINCETIEDASRISSQARHLPKTSQENAPRLVMYVDPRARKRFNAVHNVAKTIRMKSDNTVQTSIRNGRNDFLLRRKERGDQTPWGQLPPLDLDQNLPDFEVGMYKNIYVQQTEEEEAEEEEINEEENMDEEDRENISNEIRRQYENDQMEEQMKAKRNHSDENLTGTPNPKLKRKSSIQPLGSDIEADTESDGGPENTNSIKKYLHSTLKDQERPSSQGERDCPQSIPETPTSPMNKFITRYHSEQPRMNSKSSHFEAINSKTSQNKPKFDIGQNHGQ